MAEADLREQRRRDAVVLHSLFWHIPSHPQKQDKLRPINCLLSTTMASGGPRYIPPALRVNAAQQPTASDTVRDVLQQINSMPTSMTRSRLFNRLHALLQPNGRTLFEYHAFSLLQEALESHAELKWFTARLQTLWQHVLPSEDQ